MRPAKPKSPFPCEEAPLSVRARLEANGQDRCRGYRPRSAKSRRRVSQFQLFQLANPGTLGMRGHCLLSFAFHFSSFILFVVLPSLSERAIKMIGIRRFASLLRLRVLF